MIQKTETIQFQYCRKTPQSVNDCQAMTRAYSCLLVEVFCLINIKRVSLKRHMSYGDIFWKGLLLAGRTCNDVHARRINWRNPHIFKTK